MVVTFGNFHSSLFILHSSLRRRRFFTPKFMRINKTKYTTRHILKWLWSHHAPCRSRAVINMSIGLAQVGISLAFVEAMRQLTDIAVHNISGSLAIALAVIIALYIIDLILSITYTWTSAILGVKVQNMMQQKFFARILNSRWSGIGRFHSGDVLNRLFGDVSDIVRLMTEVVPNTLVIIVQFIASFCYLYIMDRSLAIIIICVTPVFLLLARFYLRRMRRIVRKIKDSNSALQAIIQESIQHKMVIKVLGQSAAMVTNLDRRQRLLRAQTKGRARFTVLSSIVRFTGFSGAYLIALSWAIYELYDGIITIGMFMAFQQLIFRIQRPMESMTRLLPVFVNSLTSSERLIELEELEQEDIDNPTMFNEPMGIRFENVDYRYNEKSRLVLEQFSHDFKPGSFTAILGATGAGKTTLIRLMLSLINPTSGNVKAYSATKNHIATPNLRCNFSYVPQGNSLFSGTIRDNLRMSNPEATTEDMNKALRIALADFVFDLPDGLDTVCGESGGGLSEGQAQRISIARAIIHPCHVLLLDEATSALDIETERKVLENIKTHYADTTIIFVTHRLAVVDFTTDSITVKKHEDKKDSTDNLRK